MAHRQQKQSVLDMSKYMDKEVRVKFMGGREVVGVLKGYDALLNLVLDETKVEGDVAGLAPLVKLTKLYLDDAKVEGDHEKLKAIQAERAAASP